MQIKKKIDYSIIIPVYYNELSLRSVFNEIYNKVILINKNLKGEIVFIDDGSGDNSLLVLLEIKNSHSKLIKIIKLSKNFGQVAALYAGYHNSSGKCIITISADMQDPIELINDMLRAFFVEKYDKVICERKSRKESFYRKFTSKLAYGFIKKIAFKDLPEGGFDYFLISKQIKDILISNRELNPYIQGQVISAGFKTKFIPYERRMRRFGESKWSFWKKIKYFIDSIISYSYFPIRLMSGVGIILAALGFTYAIGIMIKYFLWSNPIPGWSPIMILILLIGGFQMIMLGIIGEYLWRALDQVRNRPMYIIEKMYE